MRRHVHILVLANANLTINVTLALFPGPPTKESWNKLLSLQVLAAFPGSHAWEEPGYPGIYSRLSYFRTPALTFSHDGSPLALQLH